VEAISNESGEKKKKNQVSSQEAGPINLARRKSFDTGLRGDKMGLTMIFTTGALDSWEDFIYGKKFGERLGA